MTAAAHKTRSDRLPAWARSAESLRAKWTREVARGTFRVFMEKQLSLRERRMFAVAASRTPRVSPFLSDPFSVDLLVILERSCDGLCGEAVVAAAKSDRIDEIRRDPDRLEAYLKAWKHPEEVDYQGRLLVAVVGPGWRFSPAWRTDTAVALARAMYDARDFSAMDILADALQDAGAPDGPMLVQMRDPAQAWCRGARVVDELLGKR